MTDFTALGLPADLPEIAPPDLMISTDDPAPDTPDLSTRQKAAIVVRVLLAGGERLTLTDLPQAMQMDLAKTLSTLKGIDKATERKVVAEFLKALDGGGGSYGHGMEGAISMLEGSISPEVAKKLAGTNNIPNRTDPWPRINDFPSAKIAAILENESPEIAAVCLSKLGGKKAAEILAAIDGPKARRAAFTVSRISEAAPDAVRNIGRALLSQLSDEPRRAFNNDPAELVGSILLSANARTRDDILQGLKEEDQGFADRVREELFIFSDIAGRVQTTDIPKVLRDLDQGALMNALKFAETTGGADAESATFILDNMSKRMAEGLREDMAQLADIDGELGELGQAAVVEAIRNLEEAGDLVLKPREKPSSTAQE